MCALRPQCAFFCLLVHEAADNDRVQERKTNFFFWPSRAGGEQSEPSREFL